MKLTPPSALLLICLLGAFSAGSMTAAAQEKPRAAVTATKPVKPTAKPVVKKPATASKKTAAAQKRKPIATKSKSGSEIARTRLTPAKLDLSLPPEMVKELEPIGSVPLPRHQPLLPPMFGEKPQPQSPFQLNGRLLSNEMNLQLRNESRQDIEGAAIEFEFKQ